MAAETKAKVSRKALEQRRTSIETAIRKKRECEKKALEIVEYLVENKTTSSNWLIENSRYISPQYYDDVTEERAITKICGYPLCSNPLTTVQNKKFTISTKTNKVYDITERKKFCCDKCFSSSKHFKGQLPTSPLWMREEERLPIVEIPATLKSVPGDEVLITSIELPDDNKEEEMVFERQEEKAKKEKREREPQGGGCGLRPHPCDVIFKSLRRWFCAKTLDWLENTEDLTSDEKVEEVTERMADLKVIKASEEEESPAVYKRASSYGTLKRDEKNAELKVRAFLSGRLEYANEGEDEKEKENEEWNEVGPDAVEVPIVMPLANLSAQRALRRKVVLDYLEKWLIGFSASNSLKLHQYQQDLHSLVLTFNFTADTITFRPDEVPILSAAILLILGKKNPEIRNAMLEPHLQERFSKILSPFASSLQDLEEFLEDLVESCKNISM